MNNSLPVPISRAERALIDRYIRDHGITYIPCGVSGEDYPQTTKAACWGGVRCKQSKALRQELAERRQLYRKLVDEGKNGPEIAEIVGVTRQAVYGTLRRMQLKTKPRIWAPSDG